MLTWTEVVALVSVVFVACLVPALVILALWRAWRGERGEMQAWFDAQLARLEAQLEAERAAKLKLTNDYIRAMTQVAGVVMGDEDEGVVMGDEDEGGDADTAG
jgi:hypothetical protein